MRGCRHLKNKKPIIFIICLNLICTTIKDQLNLIKIYDYVQILKSFVMLYINENVYLSIA